MKVRIFFKYFPYILIGIMAFVLFKKGDVGHIKNTIDIKRDTIVKYIKVDSIHTKFDTIYLPSPVKYRNNPHNKELIAKYKSAKDKLKLYRDAIKEKSYQEIYEDSIQKVTVYSKVQGRLVKQSVNTTLKPKRYKYKETTITRTITKYDNDRVFIGISIYVPFTIGDNVDYSIDAAFKNKKGNIFEVGASPKIAKVGYKFNLW